MNFGKIIKSPVGLDAPLLTPALPSSSQPGAAGPTKVTS